MYSTKRTNKNFVDNNAYNTIGDPYKDPKQNPFRAGIPGEKLNPWKSDHYPKNEGNGNFTKVVYHPDVYQDGIKYITTQPLDTRKNGFGTKDAKKRDEFSNYIRTEQYRETIKKEKKFTDEAALSIGEKMKELLATQGLDTEDAIKRNEMLMTANKPIVHTTKIMQNYDEQVSQYDIGRTRTNDFNPKSTKDTFYRFHDERERRLKDKPVCTDIGAAAWSVKYEPPKHGGKSSLKHFDDKSHLNVIKLENL